MDLSTTQRESTSKADRKLKLELPSAKYLVIKEIGYPFRIRGEPKPSGLEIDNEQLFIDYAREQWAGSIVSGGTYLFDRYVMPDYAFQVTYVEPKEAIITRDTQITLESQIPEPIHGTKVLLDDVIGHETVKRKCRVILKYLANPSRFGEWAPRAVLFYGVPGTGKTLTARALAHESDAQILTAKASDLIGTHVGDGGRRISTLFEEARRLAPSIVFIDELDAIGLARSFQSIRGDVSEVVTALLGELDKTDESSGVVVIGATNAPLLIDPALRSRFDTTFEFTLPNDEERSKILQLYTSRLPIPLDFNLELLIPRTKGFSGRDLRDRVLKEALHEAIARDLVVIPFEIVSGIIQNISKQHSPNYSI